MLDCDDGAIMIERDPRAFFVSIMVSAGCHLLFFIGAIYIIGIKPDVNPLFQDRVIDISLVSLSEKVRAPVLSAKPKKVETSELPAKVVKPLEDTLPTETVSVPEKKSLKKETFNTKEMETVKIKEIETVKIKTSLKKETYEVAKVRQSAIKDIEKKVNETKIDPIEEALSRLKKKVESTGPPKYVEEGKGNEKDEKTIIEKEIPSGYVGRSFEQFPDVPEGGVKGAPTLGEIYHTETAFQIERNWAFATSLAGGQTDLKAEVAFKVMPDGKIVDIWFDTRSGNAYFDDAAHKAIMKSSPLPPFPEGLNVPFLILGIRFNPQGIR